MTPLSSEDLVERVARIINGFASWADDCVVTHEAFDAKLTEAALSAIAAFPDLSVLQGEVERLRGALGVAVEAIKAVGREHPLTPTGNAVLAQLEAVLLPDLEGEDQTVSQSRVPDMTAQGPHRQAQRKSEEG